MTAQNFGSSTPLIYQAGDLIHVLNDFLPESAKRTFHVSCKAGDVLTVDVDFAHGTLTRTSTGMICFVTEEEVYKYCRYEAKGQ